MWIHILKYYWFSLKQFFFYFFFFFDNVLLVLVTVNDLCIVKYSSILSKLHTFIAIGKLYLISKSIETKFISRIYIFIFQKSIPFVLVYNRLKSRTVFNVNNN